MKPLNINEYIAAQDADRRATLQKVRDTIRAVAPDAIEKISYQMPTFWQGENLIHFATFKDHLSIFPGGDASGVFADRLTVKGIDYNKGTIRFPWSKPIDYELIADIARWRVEQAKARKKK